MIWLVVQRMLRYVSKVGITTFAFLLFHLFVFFVCAVFAEPRPNGSILTPTLGILSAVVVLLCIGGVIGVVFLRRQCQRDTGQVGGGDGTGHNALHRSESSGLVGHQHLNGSGAATISKTVLGGGSTNTLRSQSLKPLLMVGRVDVDGVTVMDGQMYAARIDTERWNHSKDPLYAGHTSAISSQLGWPVGEPPPSASTSPPPPPSAAMMMEAGLITPPYTTDSSLELRSPDIIPPPVIGNNRSTSGFNIQATHATSLDTCKSYLLVSVVLVRLKERDIFLL